MEIQAQYFPVDVKRLAGDKYNSVVIPMKLDEPDGSTYFSLDFSATGDYLWSEASRYKDANGVRVPVLRIKPVDNAGVAALLTLAWNAREELLEQQPKFKLTEAIGIVFDPADIKGAYLHFGLFVKMR